MLLKRIICGNYAYFRFLIGRHPAIAVQNIFLDVYT